MGLLASQVKPKKPLGLVAFTPDGDRLRFTDESVWGFFVSWGINVNIDMKRSKFLKLWKRHSLPTRQVISSDVLEPSARRRWLIVADAMRGEYEAQRSDGSIVQIIRMSANKYRIVRIRKDLTGHDVKVKKTNMLMFDPSDDDGPFLMEDPTRDTDVRSFVVNKYDHTLTHIETDEARRYVVELLIHHGFGALVTQKGGVYYVDIKHTKLLRKLHKFIKSTGNKLGIFPIIKVAEGGDIDYMPLLQSVMAYQVRRQFKRDTTNIKKMLVKDLNNKLIGKYIGMLNIILSKIKYYTMRFNIDDVYKEVRLEAQDLTDKLRERLSINLDMQTLRV